jgi:hypothetical protein
VVLIKEKVVGSFQRASDQRIDGYGSSSSAPTSRKLASDSSVFNFIVIEDIFFSFESSCTLTDLLMMVPRL